MKQLQACPLVNNKEEKCFGNVQAYPKYDQASFFNKSWILGVAMFICPLLKPALLRVFLRQLLTVLTGQTRQAVHVIKQSIF